MIINKIAKLMQYLPDSAVKYLSVKIVNHMIDKYANIEVKGRENIDGIKTPVIYICNHLSNSDGIILNKVLEDKDVSFIAGVKLSNDPYTNIGVNVVKTIPIKPNSADKEALTKMVQTIKDGSSILIFPEGTRSRTGSMIEAKKGIVLIARLTKVPIIPIGLWGTEKLMPINKEGNMSSEKFNHADVKVSIGKPINLPVKEDNEDKHQYEERALLKLMKSIAELIPEEYRGVYK